MRKITLLPMRVRKTMRVMSMALLGLIPLSVLGQTEISTVQGLKDIAKNLSGSYKLTADITLTEEWLPIGTDAAPFTGTLDGNGHIVKGLKTTNSSTNNVGLISVAKAATIQKLGLESVNLQGAQNVAPFIGKSISSKVSECYSTGYINGNDHVAGIVGGTYQATPAVRSEISDCYSTANVYSRTYQCGGILGTASDVIIKNVYFSGICWSQTNTGGIVSLIDAASAELDVNANVIENSVAISPFIDGGTTRRILGNAAGRSVMLNNNYAKTDMLVNGVVVDELNDLEYGATMAQGENKTLAELKTVAFYTTLGWSADIWKFTEGTFPVLKWQTVPAAIDQILGLPTALVKCEVGQPRQLKMASAFGQTLTFESSKPNVVTIDASGNVSALTTGTATITVSSPATAVSQAVSTTFTLNVFSLSGDITTADDLDNIRYKLDGVFNLRNDITVTDKWIPIVGFTGTLNGNGFVIRGLNYNDPTMNNVGLFASTSKAKISRLGIENARLIGNADVGGIVGNAKDSTVISECYVANSYIEGRDHVASIVGAARGLSSINNCYGTAEIFSRQYQAAGIAGIFAQGTIDKCYFSGIISISGGSSNIGGMVSLLDDGTEETNVVSNSVILAPYMIGGTVNRIIASVNGRAISLINNYSREDVQRGKGLNNLGGIAVDDANYGTDKMHGANVTIADSKTKSFYQDVLTWDMDNVWTMAGEGEIYPILKWQKTPITPSILSVPASLKVKKGVSVKVKSYGSMGQAVTYSSAQLDKILSYWAEVDANTGEISYVLFGTDDASLTYGLATVDIESEATSYMTAAKSSFTIDVVDPASLIKNIYTATDLVNMGQDLIAEYKLKADIDLSSIADWTPIGTAAAPFKGSLDGNGFKILNLKSSRSSTNLIGLFGVAQDAIFKNIELIDVNLVGNQDVGPLVGKAIGVQVSHVHTTGVIEGNDHVGSIIGGIYAGNTSNVKNCYSTADVKTRNYQAGGMLGVASSTNLENCYFAGTVIAAATASPYNNAAGLIALTEDANVAISNCVSAASTVIGGTANPYVARGSATFTSCIYRSDMSVSAPVDASNYGNEQPDPAQAVELNSLKQQTTYTGLGWDFATVWEVKNGDFPTFKAIYSAVPVTKADASGYAAAVKNNKIQLKGVTNAEVAIYTANGILVGRASAVSTEVNVKLPVKGIYLVSVVEGGKVTVLKVINN